MYEAQFETLGFTRTEAVVYLSLAKSGRASAQAIARRVNLARTTVYSVLENLEAKGLAKREKKGQTTLFSANRPAAFLRLLESEREDLARKQQVARSLVDAIEPLFRNTGPLAPKLQIFQGQRAVENMLYDYVEAWRQGMRETDLTWWGYQDHTFVEHYLRWLQDYWRVKNPAEKVQLISNDVALEKELRGQVPGREIRPVSTSLDFSSTIWVCGDYIILIVTREEPHSAYQLRDALFANNLRLIFSLLWSKL